MCHLMKKKKEQELGPKDNWAQTIINLGFLLLLLLCFVSSGNGFAVPAARRGHEGGESAAASLRRRMVTAMWYSRMISRITSPRARFVSVYLI